MHHSCAAFAGLAGAGCERFVLSWPLSAGAKSETRREDDGPRSDGEPLHAVRTTCHFVTAAACCAIASQRALLTSALLAPPPPRPFRRCSRRIWQTWGRRARAESKGPRRVGKSDKAAMSRREFNVRHYLGATPCSPVRCAAAAGGWWWRPRGWWLWWCGVVVAAGAAGVRRLRWACSS